MLLSYWLLGQGKSVLIAIEVDNLIDIGDCGWRVNQPGNSAIPKFRDFYLGFSLKFLMLPHLCVLTGVPH